MSSTTTEIGVIGQKYEDRKTGKTGVLLIRNEKYKTLELVADDGKSFNITFASFRSNWRKCKTEEVVNESQAETLVEETPVVEETNVITNEEFMHKSADVQLKKNPKTLDLGNLAMMETFGIFADNVKIHIEEEDLLLHIKLREKFGGVIIKDGRKNAFEFWVKPESDAVEMCMTEELYKAIKWSYMTTLEIKPLYGSRSHVVRFENISDATRVTTLLKDVLEGLKIVQPNINKKDEVNE